MKVIASDFPPGRKSRFVKSCLWGCFLLVGMMVLIVLILIGMVWHFLGRIPKNYPPSQHPIATVSNAGPRTSYPKGFDSPYLGHTGSWDGKGGGMFGQSKIHDLDAEAGMGLRWTFMPVYWRALEPDGPVDLKLAVPKAWRELDAFVIEAHRRGLNILMQAPVIGGNAGGPPPWAGLRAAGKSAPLDMEAAAAFARKLAERYSPGGFLATREGWGNSFGVRAWEMDNEPDSYRIHWAGQAADYAEFVTKVSRAIKQVDSLALIVAPGIPVSRTSSAWLTGALNPELRQGSSTGQGQGQSWSIGPAIDVVSFHIYEGLDSVFNGEDRDIEMAFDEIRGMFDQAQSSFPGLEFAHKSEYWHTEGNFDFLGILSAPRRAAWRMQFMTRAFTAGVAKVCVMDASPVEQVAIRTYVRSLPNPFPMRRMSNQVEILSGRVMAFWHPDGDLPKTGGVSVLWAEAGTGEARVSLSIEHAKVTIWQVNGDSQVLSAEKERVIIPLRGDEKMAPPVIVVDRPIGPPERR